MQNSFILFSAIKLPYYYNQNKNSGKRLYHIESMS
jgi:hypothetical protein